MTKSDTAQKEVRLASTVILARQDKEELQIYLLKRSRRSGFMPSYYVFPGGTIDLEDHDPALCNEHTENDPNAVSGLVDEDFPRQDAIAYCVAAVRETFEEAGVFLHDSGERDHGGLQRMRERRVIGSLPKGWLRDLVLSEGWVLNFSRLKRWSHWVTPELMPKRFDTRFFLSLMPLGQKCVPDNRETTHGIWINPEKALAANLKGETPLSPPTLVTLHELLPYSNMDDLQKELKVRPWGETLFPRLIPLSEGGLILEPWDPMRNQEIKIDGKALENLILPVGKPFSRIWNHKGTWKAVGI
ncbi:MAG: hypothetical protein U9N82_04910 [Thermodesulfobacteriota bacterium]|nr:hypothetical protein [Thermodesulfobacteriota bacterium]